MASVLFLTVDGGGNVPPALAIAHELQHRGHQIRFLADASQKALITSHGFGFASYQHAKHWSARDRKNPIASLLAFSRVLSDPGPALDVETEIAAHPADVIVIDALIPASVPAASAHGVPTVVLMHTFAEFFHAPIVEVPGAIRGESPRKNWARASLVLVAADRELDTPPVPEPVNYVWTGVAEPRAVRSELTDPTTVLVSLSTAFASNQTRVYQHIVDALALLPVTAVVTTGPTVNPDHVVPAANTTVMKFAPHADIMPSCSLVIGHGGHSTTMKALMHGIPLLILPMTPIDQPMIAKAIARAGAGLALPKSASKRRIATAAATILGDSTYALNAAGIGERLRDHDGIVDAANRILALVPLSTLAPTATLPR